MVAVVVITQSFTLGVSFHLYMYLFCFDFISIKRKHWYRKLLFRSSEEALEVLLKFLEFEGMRDAMRKELSTKFDFIMRQFIKEITIIEDRFTVSNS